MAASGSGTITPIGGIPAIGLGAAQPLPRTLLPLQRYAQIMQIPLTHFQQFNGTQAPLSKGCEELWDQDARETLAWTILQAEEMIAEELGTWPAPKFIINEQIAFNLPGVRRDWRNAEINTRWGKVEGFGTEKLTLVQAAANVTYQDFDSDPLGRSSVATITVGNVNLPACAGPCEVAVFFREADGADNTADDRWEIRPLKVVISGSTMAISGESALFVKPTLWALTKQDCAGSDNTTAWHINFSTGNLVSAVDVYCRTIDTQTPVTLRWDGICRCPGPCDHETQAACAYNTDNDRGFFIPRPATWNGTANIEATPTVITPPESILVNYRAGFPLDTRSCTMNRNMERAIVKLTNALLPEPPCGFCDPAKWRWNEDRKNVDPLTPEAASLPWDIYKQGALEAWRIVKMFRRGRGVKLGRGHR